MAPLGHLAQGGWRAATGTGRDAMHIDSAGMALPVLKRVIRSWARDCVVLLDAQILHRMACGTNRRQQLQFAVKQRLAPLGVAGPHGEDAIAQAQRSAVASELVAGQGRPVLPESR